MARLAETTDDGEVAALAEQLGAAGDTCAIRPRHLLAPEVVEVITGLGPAVPLRYLIAPQV